MLKAQVTLGFLILCGLSSTARAAYVDEVIAKADQIKLYEQRSWKKLLFEMTFDDMEFYRGGKAGRKDYRVEMVETLKALLQDAPIVIKGKERHAQCYYPARFDYLKRELGLDPAKMPKPSCPDLEDFRKFASYTGVSLVFSNYFANNPASTFGHTLLRLHRSVKEGEPGLLDDAANFAAHIGDVSALIYPFKGLMGYFPGRFALLPYSTKIQEYSNYESRDLWEYELTFTPEEAHRLALSLWEAAYFWMDYFYLDENCAFMILALLEATRPSLDLTSTFHLYTIPSDTVKVVVKAPNLVKSIQFKPSARARYLERAENLKGFERDVFLQIIGKFKDKYSKEDLDAYLHQPGCDDDCRIRILDTVSEFIDFREKKVSTKKLEMYKGLRNGALISRSKIAKPSPAFVARPEHSRPDRGPRSSMVELNSGFTNYGYNMSEFRWRPAHHDLGSSSLGYSDQLQIQIMDTVIAHGDRYDQWYLKKFVPLDLTSLGKHELALSPRSWRVDLGYWKDRNRKEEEDLYDRTQLHVGFGGARFRGRFGAYVLAQFSGGYSSDRELFWHFGLGPKAGVYYAFSDSLKFSTLFEFTRMYGTNGDLDRRETISRLSYFWRLENEAYLEYRDQDFEHYGGAGYRFYY